MGMAATASPGLAFQVDAATTQMEILAPGAAIPEDDDEVPAASQGADSLLARALKALDAGMREVPESAVAAVTRAMSLGRRSRITYADLAGVDQLQKELHNLVTLPLTQPEFFTRHGLDPPQGVLMHGPPGSGKTLLACAASAEAGANMMVRSSETIDKTTSFH